MSNVMRPEPSAVLPRDKLDTANAEKLVALGFPAVEPVLPQLLEWMQDFNWPVAQVLQHLLASIGAPLAPYVRVVLSQEDEIWKYWVLHCIVRESKELAGMLRADLQRIALSPTASEKKEDVDLVVKEILEGIQ